MDAERFRAEWVPRASGEVPEMGIGSGLNLPFYSSETQHVSGVDPSAELQRMARKRAAQLPIEVEFFAQSGEEPLPLPDAGVDTPSVHLSLVVVRQVF